MPTRRAPSRSAVAAALSATAFLTVAGAAGAVLVLDDPDAPEASRVEALAQGTLSIADSRDGRAILTAADVAPGDAAEGTLTIRNTGTLPGVLALRSTGVEADGPRDRALLRALRLQVSDVTGGASTRVHDGGLDDVDEPALGAVAPGTGRTFRFVARLPETPGADNRVQDATVQLGFRWTLTSDGTADPDSPPTTTAPPTTTTPPTMDQPGVPPAPPAPGPGPAPAPAPDPGGSPPPAPAPTPTGRRPAVVRMATRAVRVDRVSRFGVRVSCARGARGCRVRVLVRRGRATINARTLTLRPGRSIVVRTRATPAMRRSLRRGHPVLVRVVFRAPAGVRVPRTTRVVVRPAIPARRPRPFTP